MGQCRCRTSWAREPPSSVGWDEKVGSSPCGRSGAPPRCDETPPVVHVHVHAPHELTETRAPAGPPPGVERRLELAAVLLLALTTLATAWSGYQAARWSGEQSQHYARASATRIKAQQCRRGRPARGSTTSCTSTGGSTPARPATELATIYARFRPEFVPGVPRLDRPAPFTNPGDRAAVHAAVPTAAGARATLDAARTSSIRRAPRPRPTTTSTSCRRSSSRRCCSSRASRCACSGGRCGRGARPGRSRCSSAASGSCSALPVA